MNSSHELEQVPGEIVWHGRLDGGREDPKRWRGKISAKIDVLKARLALPEDETLDYVERFKNALNRYFIPTDPDGHVRCIDGRVKNKQPVDNPKLGPQVSGGTPAATLSYRLALFDQLPQGATIEDDLEEVRQVIEKLDLPFHPGGHEDEHSEHSDTATGCGAIDKMLEILEIMTDREAVYEYTKAISGDYFDEELFDKLQERISLMNRPEFQQKYFMKDPKTGRFNYANSLIHKAKKIGSGQGRKAVEKLLGAHNEIALVVNMVPNTTFNRDQLSFDTSHLAQAFNYDFWASVQRAKDIFAGDEEAQKAVIISQAMYAVGTAMALTDGSLELGIRQ